MNHKTNKVFVLDDDDKSNLALTKVLQGAGYTVKTFNHFAQIQSVLKTEVPDALLSLIRIQRALVAQTF